MLVTQTWREIVPLFPRFRIVAVSVQRLQVRIARVAVVSVAMIHLDPVVMLGFQEQSGSCRAPHGGEIARYPLFAPSAAPKS
jgi:hypothetical protein